MSKKSLVSLIGAIAFSTLIFFSGCKTKKAFLEGEYKESYYKFFHQGPYHGKRIEKEQDGTKVIYYDYGGESSSLKINWWDGTEESAFFGYIDRIEIIYPNGEKKILKNQMFRKDLGEKVFTEATKKVHNAAEYISKQKTESEINKSLLEIIPDQEKGAE